MALETEKRKLPWVWQVSRRNHYSWVSNDLRGHHHKTKLYVHCSWDRIQRLNSKINLDVISSLSSKTSPGKIRSHSSDSENHSASSDFSWNGFLMWTQHELNCIWLLFLENFAEIQTEPMYCELIYQRLPIWEPEWNWEPWQLGVCSEGQVHIKMVWLWGQEECIQHTPGGRSLLLVPWQGQREGDRVTTMWWNEDELWNHPWILIMAPPWRSLMIFE